MKKNFLMLLSILLLVSSCEKMIQVDKDGDTVTDGNFNVIVFEVEHTRFDDFTRAVLADACVRLNYAVYDEEGERVRQVNQTADKESFGKATFQLDAGNYTVVVVGHNSNGNPTMTNMQKIQFTNATGYSDTFICTTDDVVVADEEVTLNVSLGRIVSLCRFVLTDDYPEGVAKMKFYYTGGSGTFDAHTALGNTNSKQTMTFDVKDGKKQFDLYTFLHDTEGALSLKVTALDAQDNVLRERTFDIPMYQKQITWVTGAYFSGSSSSSGNVSVITVDTNWAGEHHINF